MGPDTTEGVISPTDGKGATSFIRYVIFYRYQTITGPNNHEYQEKVNMFAFLNGKRDDQKNCYAAQLIFRR